MAEDTVLDDGSRSAAVLAPALAAWRSESSLAAALADPASIRIVLDADGARMIDASEAGRRLMRQIGRAGVLPAGVAGQILRGAGGGPRLLRLRLDPRGVAPPTLCRLARADGSDGRPVFLLLVDGAVPGPRAVPARQPAPAESGAGLPLPQPGSRFLWRTDAEGVLGRISDGQDRLAGLAGQSFEALARAGRIGGAVPALLAALSERATFRALAIDVRFGRASGLSVQLSGAPAARAGQPFAGFSGFGIVRAAGSGPVAAAPDGPGLTGAPAATASEPVIRPERQPGEAPAATEAASVPGPVDLEAGSSPGPAALPEAAPGAEAEPAAAAEGGLSLSEHAAFREIARALGARYAGDEEPAEAGRDPQAEGGSVTPFPGARPAPEPDPAALLDGIPGAILVHRGPAILAANAALLALAGYPDLHALQTAGLDRLFRGLAPGRHAGEEPLTLAIEGADGQARPVALSRARMAWTGGAADCLLLRPVPADDPQGRRSAEDLARSFREARGTDALGALDALEDGVAILDGQGRVLTLNRAAVALFACDPREVVGSAFPALLAAEAAPAAQAVLDGRQPQATLAVAGRSFGLRVAALGPDRRAAILRAKGAEGAKAFARGFLASLDRGIRTPLTGILGFAEMILKEPHGPLGHPGYRAYLQDICSSGEHVMALVTDLIDLAGLEAGGVALTRKCLPLNDLVAACVADLQPQATQNRIVLRTSFAENLALVEADETSLNRVARIVIGNAIRLSGAGGQVIVSTIPAENGAVSLRVRDTGPGLSPDEIASALRAFGDDAGTGPEIGRGLGLPLMRALVEANDGSLNISSRKDEGTLVEIQLPVARAAKRA